MFTHLCATKSVKNLEQEDGGILQAQSYITVSGYIVLEMAVCTNVEAELLMLVVSGKLETMQIFSK
jgi:L-lactate utilization protein LutC